MKVNTQSDTLRRLSGEMASALGKKYVTAVAAGDLGYAATIAGLIQQNLSVSESQDEQELRQAIEQVGEELGVPIEFTITRKR